MIHHAPPWTRLVYLLFSLTTIIGTFWVSLQPSGPPAAATVLVGAFLAYVFIRGIVMAVICDTDRVLVRGLLYSRSIPVKQIMAVTELPALRWRSTSGRVRWTPITALMVGNPRYPQFYQKHIDDALLDVRSWIDSNRG